MNEIYQQIKSECELPVSQFYYTYRDFDGALCWGSIVISFKDNDEIRKNLLVTDPEQRGFFTTDQCRLTNGLPFKPEDQDTVEDLLTITEKEVEFWNNINVSPDYIYDLASEGYEEFV